MPSSRSLVAVTAAVLISLVTPVSATPSLVIDMETRAVLHADDAGHPWFPASTTKLMTALVTFKAIERGDVTLDTPVVMSKNAVGLSVANSGLGLGRTMRLEDALYAVLVGSANDVAVALAEAVSGSEKAFVARMNEEAARLDMSASRFVNPNGLHARAQTVSARDLAILGLTLYENYQQFRPIFQTSEVSIDGKEIQSFNTLLTQFPGTVGMKTGFVCASGRNIVALTERGGKRFLTVVLGATTGRERSERGAKLMTEAFEGSLMPTGTTLNDLANEPEIRPQDMRMRLCSDQTAPYEAKQQALYPMGLPRHTSYLKDPTPHVGRVITTWQTDLSPVPPRPAPKPAFARRAPPPAPTDAGWSSVRPAPKPAL
ncbi:D-alanyl-D-alanine carboxypeptidase [Roseibium hamelinense]|nr:D-alanyl-D-alanine carboxypeptidase family protein [Roseibium hamelinense]MTI45198.1 D-alanyl-D-alanine carboxypeptidase [Roseibium hamelinense]